MRRWALADADWNSWPGGLSIAEIFAQAADLGLGGIELGVYDAALELTSQRLDEVRGGADTTGVPVTDMLLSLPVERWPCGALSGEPARLVDQVRACAEVCRERGLPVLGLWPGADPPGARVVEALRRCVEAAGDVRIAIEYKAGTVVADAAEALVLCEQVPDLGVLLDTGHAYAAGEDPAEVVERLGEALLHVHLGDAGVGGSDDDLPCGRRHDFAPVVAALDASYAGTAAFDLYGAVGAGLLGGADAVRESRDHLLSRPA